MPGKRPQKTAGVSSQQTGRKTALASSGKTVLEKNRENRPFKQAGKQPGQRSEERAPIKSQENGVSNQPGENITNKRENSHIQKDQKTVQENWTFF